MRMKTFMLLNMAMVALLVVLLAGCASKTPVPQKQVTMAAHSIDQAESSGAVKFAPVELKSAREKLSQAKLAITNKENLKAEQLADEAMVDANLAEAKARSAKSQKIVEELKESIRVLREEMSR